MHVDSEEYDRLSLSLNPNDSFAICMLILFCRSQNKNILQLPLMHHLRAHQISLYVVLVIYASMITNRTPKSLVYSLLQCLLLANFL